MPIAWTRTFKHESGQQNKIFTTTMGAATDLENESLRRLVVNAVFWSVNLPVPAKANVTLVDPFTPRKYGFKGYRYQLTPAAYALGQTVPVGGNPPPAPPAKKQAATKSASPALSSQPSALSSINAPISLNPGERIAIVGNTLADRMQHHNHLEALITQKFPQHNLTFRNLSAAGDEVVTRARSKDFGTPDEWLTKVQPSVVFVFLGYNESFAGAEGLPKFKQDLEAYLNNVRTKSYNGVAPPRIVLFSPIANEQIPGTEFAVPAANNKNLALYSAAMAEVAGDKAGVTFVDLFAPSQKLSAAALAQGRSLTINGIHLSESGDALLAPEVFKTLFGSAAPSLDTPDAQKLRALIAEKNTWWHSRYRTVDGYNVYGDRSKIAYESKPGEPKITNTQIMMEEMAQRDTLAANVERRVWAAAKGQPYNPADDLPLPPVTPFGTNKPGPKPDGTYEFLSAEEAITKMTLAPGLKANVFASEKEFPELAKALQFAWDTKGRLWVAVWPSYPELTPTATIKDKLLVLEDTNGDGKADKCTTFLDGLNCPTGFQFFKDGVLVMQAPDLWFVRDTDGDGKADWKERVLMGLDSADSHHTANSLIYEPGGAIILSDGVFHRTQVETAVGPVRNVDGALYRYEPLTGRFETYVAYGFANPHGRAFDRWGNDIITDATGNQTYFGPAFSGKLDFPAKHPRMKTIWDRPSRPSAGSTIITSTHFPAEYWGNYINPNVIGFQGIYRVKLTDDGSGRMGIRQSDIVQSSDKNFRPIDTNIGPDGALYVVDWHNPLIGHLQSHLRDSNRDKVHGRIYRITYEGRALAVPPKIDGQPIPALLELLKRPEDQIRTLAKIELGKHPSAAVIAAAKKWIAGLDTAHADYAHHLTEALWLHQWHNVVDLDLLARVLKSPSADARAAATRVISYWRERVPNALALLRTAATDDHPRVRLQASRAASFFSSLDAVEVALAASKKPIDYYLDYTIGETLRQLRPFWRKSIEEGGNVGGGDPASLRYLLRSLTVAELTKMAPTPDVLENILGRAGVSDTARTDALAGLAKARSATKVNLLLDVLNSPAEIDAKSVGRLLLNQPAADLAAHRAALMKLAVADAAEGRTYAWAAVAIGDGKLDTAWTESLKSPLSHASLLGGLPFIPDAKLRAAAYERVMPILAMPITDIQGPDHIVAAIQRDAIRTAVATKREPEKVFAALNALITRNEQVPTAAKGLRDLPRTAWTPAATAPAAQTLIAWAAKTHPSERTSRDYVETIQVADELAGSLPPAEAEPLRAKLTTLRVPVFVVRAVHEQMRFDVPRLVVPMGRAFEIIFENPDVMPHNLVVVTAGNREKVGLAAMELPAGHTDRQGRAWVPEDRAIIAATKMLEPGQSETLKMTAIRNEGTYEYVCTFPGHWAVMWGQLVVTKDVEAYLKANPLTPATTPAAHKH
jgi:azurin/glucose/arabinose dehydrogenase/lysophospholipase L1-like esterase